MGGTQRQNVYEGEGPPPYHMWQLTNAARVKHTWDDIFSVGGYKRDVGFGETCYVC